MYSIEGFGLEEGVTGGEGAILGGGTWQACDENGNLLYYGGYGSLGLGGEATLFSAHVTMSNTHTLFSFNVFDLYEDIFGEEEKDTCCIAA